MQSILSVLCFVAGLAGGLAVAWFLLRERTKALSTTLLAREATIQEMQGKVTSGVARDADLSARLETERRAAQEAQQLLSTALTAKESEVRTLCEKALSSTAREAELDTLLASERKAIQEKLEVFNDAQQKLTDAFKALSSDALARNNQAFLDLARATLAQTQEAARGDLDRRQQAIVELVTPVRTSLEKVEEKIQALEKTRVSAYATLYEQVRSLVETQTQLRDETGKLVTALRNPAARGRWGEIQLRRVVEMAGMLEHCDFLSQPTVTGDGGPLRPDLLVKLPAGKSVIVDAKTPLAGYLEGIEATDEDTRRLRMGDHARQVRNHVTALGRKSYWEQFDQAPEFVVLFLPGECFFSAALESDPGLIECGVEQNIILATPTTLIALLRAVAYGWKQEALAQNATEISLLGKELFKRLSDMAGHWRKLGESLDKAVHSYNDAIGSLESRVLVSARRFVDLKIASPDSGIEPIEPIETTARPIQALD